MLKILRGLLTNLTTLAEGRLAVTTDTGDERLYVGTPAGNIRFASYKDVTNQIDSLKDSVPSSLNTLKKLGNAINNDSSFYITLNNSLSQKASISALNTKADKTYVDSNVSSLQTQISSRATISYVDGKLLLKTSKEEMRSDTTLIDTTSAAFPVTLAAGRTLIHSSGIANPATLTLPLASTVLLNHTFFIYKGTEIFTLNTSGSDKINGVTSFNGAAGKTTFIVVKESLSNWLCKEIV